MFMMTIETSHWIPAEAADRPASETFLELNIGRRCYLHAVTERFD
jgi:hypothetical protein